jgi:hypothetical protein
MELSELEVRERDRKVAGAEKKGSVCAGMRCLLTIFSWIINQYITYSTSSRTCAFGCRSSLKIRENEPQAPSFTCCLLFPVAR